MNDYTMVIHHGGFFLGGGRTFVLMTERKLGSMKCTYSIKLLLAIMLLLNLIFEMWVAESVGYFSI